MDAQKIAEQCANYLYANDRASRDLGMSMKEIAPGYAALTMVVREDMVNGHGNCHGGFLFTLSDSAFGLACNTYNEMTVAQGCSIDFLSPAQLGDQLTAIAREQSKGRTTGVYDVLVTREDGKKVALFRGKSFSLGKPLLP